MWKQSFFARDFPQKVKVEDVKTKLFCARLPSKSESWRCENKATKLSSGGCDGGGCDGGGGGDGGGCDGGGCDSSGCESGCCCDSGGCDSGSFDSGGCGGGCVDFWMSVKRKYYGLLNYLS